MVAGSWSDQAISKWARWVHTKAAFDIRRRADHFDHLKEIISEGFSSAQSRYVTIVNVHRSTMTVSALPADFSLDALTFGPWASAFEARRLWAPSSADMLLTFDGTAPKVYPSVFFNTPNVPQPLLDQVQDPDIVETAIESLFNQDTFAAQFLQYVWAQVNREFGRGSNQAFSCFYTEIRMMLSPTDEHGSAPMPLSSNKPLPVFFNQNRRINDVTTDSPTFVQAFAWNNGSPIATGTSFLPMLIMRVLSLQSSLVSEGQIPVCLSPSLELEIGLNPPTSESLIDIDWKAWAKQERLKLKLFPIWKNFDEATKFLPMAMRIQMASYLMSFELDFQSKWPAQLPEAWEMLQTAWSPPAAIERWTKRWEVSTSAIFLDRQVFGGKSPIFGWMDFEQVPLELRLPLRNMVDDWDTWAAENEIQLHTEVYNNFHPILISRAAVKDQPLVTWPVSRIEMNAIPHLTSKTDSRMSNARKINQVHGSWLPVVDRVLVTDLLTENSPVVMLILENPFATQFRDTDGFDFMEERYKILKKAFAWPSESVIL